jgi:uncharacterized protein
LSYDHAGLISFLRKVYQCDWDGLHGINHWNRVANNGKAIGKLQRLKSADLLIINLFSYLHDSCRQNEDEDVNHGQRAAVMAWDLNGLCYDLSKCCIDKLCDAIAGHSYGTISSDITIQTCWDADRLDLNRVGLIPLEKYLSKEAAVLITKEYSQN